MEKIFYILGSIVVFIAAYFSGKWVGRNDKGTSSSGVKSDIQRAGTDSDRIGQRLEDNDVLLDGASDTVDKIENEQQGIIEGQQELKQLIERGRKALKILNG